MLLAFPTNIRLGWKGLRRTNSLLRKSINNGCKKFYRIGPNVREDFVALTNKRCVWGAKTFSITTFSIMTLSIEGLIVTLSINDTQHNSTSAIMLSARMLNAAFYVLLC